MKKTSDKNHVSKTRAVSQKEILDTRYRIGLNFFTEELSKGGEYYILTENFKTGPQYFTITLKDTKCNVYTPELAFILISRGLPVKNLETKKLEAINSSNIFARTFIKGFSEGAKHFKEWHERYPSFNDAMVKDLHYNYFHANHRPFMEGWVFVKSKFPLILTQKEIFDFGFYSGIVNEADTLVTAHPEIFNDSSQCTETAQNEVSAPPSEEREGPSIKGASYSAYAYALKLSTKNISLDKKGYGVNDGENYAKMFNLKSGVTLYNRWIEFDDKIKNPKQFESIAREIIKKHNL